MSEQLALTAPTCKHCGKPAVGHSVRGDWHVCKHHNAIEWAEGLASHPDPFYARLGKQIARAEGVRL